MNTLDKTLSERVDELVESHRRRPFVSTMGTQAAIDELIARNEGLELAIRGLAVEVERLSALQEAGESTARHGS
jgi:hypothetical protein